MKRFVVSSLTAVCIVFSSGATQSSIVNASETTATDNFDKNTMTKISDCIRKFRIQQTPRKYNVYMITGGLNTPNPDILYCGDRGGIGI